DEEKIKQDTAGAEEKARELGAKAGEEAREVGNKAKGLFSKDAQNESFVAVVTVRGLIKEVDAATGRVVMETNDKQEIATTYADSTTQMQRNKKPARLVDFQVGDKAVIVYQVKGGKSVA